MSLKKKSPLYGKFTSAATLDECETVLRHASPPRVGRWCVAGLVVALGRMMRQQVIDARAHITAARERKVVVETAAKRPQHQKVADEKTWALLDQWCADVAPFGVLETTYTFVLQVGRKQRHGGLEEAGVCPRRRRARPLTRPPEEQVRVLPLAWLPRRGRQSTCSWLAGMITLAPTLAT